MNSVRRKSEDRKLELIDAALHIIATRGIAALSTRSLAEQVGLSSGAIFRHFSSIEALLDAVVTSVEAVLEATYPSRELPARARLERFIEARSSAVGDQVGILRLVLSEQFLMALPKGGAHRLSACVQKTKTFVLGCLREGQQTGEFRSDIDAPSLALIVMGTIQMLALSTANSRLPSAEAAAARDGLLALLSPKRSSKS